MKTTNITNTLLSALVLLVAATGPAAAQMPPGTDGSDPRGWDPTLEAVRAAPGNHQVIFENDSIRVLSVTVQPGEREPVHHHPYPSVLILDALTRLVDYDANGREQKLPLPEKFEPPMVLRMPAQAAHAVHNVDSKTFHLVRIEFKKGFPVQP
jgi:quercetin dioxygenase-like cupin family protein